MKRTLIYDIKIARAILPRFSAPDPGITYCEGWHDYQQLGISIIGTYDYQECRSRAFLADNLATFQELLKSQQLIVTLNFPDLTERLLKFAGIEIPAEVENYNLSAEIWRAAGLPDIYDKLTHSEITPDEIVRANLRATQRATSELAPIWYQRGEIGNLINATIADVWSAKKLFEQICADQPLRDPRNQAMLLKPRKPN